MLTDFYTRKCVNNDQVFVVRHRYFGKEVTETVGEILKLYFSSQVRRNRLNKTNTFYTTTCKLVYKPFIQFRFTLHRGIRP